MQKCRVKQHLTILALVYSGEVAIPEIQRPFVWSAFKVWNLMDFLYKFQKFVQIQISILVRFLKDCHQKKYELTMYSIQDGQIYLRTNVIFNAMGFSGAPAIDSNGYVIGVLSGGGVADDGFLYIGIEPLTKIESYLR